MQFQKPEIREKILNSAMQLFYEQGFENTSTRQIAAEVDMSVSNLYKYFANKEEIFDEIVKQYYYRYLATFKNFVSHENKDTFDEDACTKLTKAIFESIKGFCSQFVILMDKSKGTKYENFRNEIIHGLQAHIIKEIPSDKTNAEMIHIFVRNFFNGIVEIARNHKNDETTLANISLLAQYHLKGISILYQ